MASLLGWLGKKAQGVVAQINPADNGRTYSTVMNRGAAYAPKAPASVGQQLTHNGITNVAGGSVVKPLIRGSMALNQGIGNAELALAGRPTQNAKQYFNPQGGLNGLRNFTGYTGTKRQVAGDAIVSASNIAAPGSSKILTAGATKLLPKAIPKIIPKVISSAAVGAPVGAASNVGTYVGSDQPLTKKGIVQAAKTGAEFGAIGGAVTPIVGAAAAKAIQKGAPVIRQGAQKTAQAAKQAKRELDIRTTPTILNMHPNERYTLSDFADYKAGRYTPENAAVLNQLQRDARTVAGKAGIDITSGSPANIQQRIAGFLDSYDRQKNAVKQGGYIRIPSGENPEEFLRSRQEDFKSQLPSAKTDKQRNFLQDKVTEIDKQLKGGTNVAGRNGHIRLPEGADAPKQARPAPSMPTAPQGTIELPKVGVKNVSTVDKVFRSTRSVIERQGEHGQQLAGMLQGARDTQELYQAQLLKQLPTVRKLEDNDFENFVNATQGLDKPRTPQVAQAIQEWQTAHPAIRDRAVAAGLDVGDLGQTYYPHFVDYKAVFKDRNTYNEAINHLVQTGQAPSQEEAIKLLGYARDVSRNRQFGNLEASRLVDLPNYDKTPNSLVGYIQGSTRRVAHAETFGPKDENALKLITKAGQQGYDTEAAKNAYDVAVGAKQYNPNTKAFSNNVRRYLTTTRLGLGALTNSSQNVNTGIVTGHLRTLGAMVKQLDPKTRAFVQDTGTIADAVINDIREQSGFTGKVIAKITAPGFGAVEKFNRSVAATSGRDYALRLAQKGDGATLRKLGVTGDISNRTLTDAQQIQAARKIVEKTQFKVDPQDLPGWVDSPGGKLVAQFRTFSYNQSKFFSNEILKPAAKGNLLPLSRLLAALPVGYGLYETKRRIAGRPQETDKKRVALESFGNVGGAGLAVDVFRSMVPLNNKSLTPDRRVSMAVGAFGGPAAGTTAELLGAASNAAPKALGGTADATQLARVGIRQIPILGTAIQNRTVPYKSATTPTSEPTPKQTTTDGSSKEDAAAVKQIKATAKGSDYTLQQLPSGRYFDQIGGDFKTFDTIKQARQAIGKSTFDKSGQSYKVAGDTVYRRSAEGTVSATPKTKFDYQLGQATLTQQKNAGDIRGWLDTANKQLGSISKQLQDPAIDPLDALTLQNDATALQKSIKSYSQYGGFTKPKSGSISASFKTASIKAPALPKIAARKPANFRAPSVRKLAVSKIPTKFTRRKQTA